MSESRTLSGDELARVGRVVETLNELPESARELVEAADVLYWAARNEAGGFGAASRRAIESHDRAKAKFKRLLADAPIAHVANAFIALRSAAHLLAAIAASPAPNGDQK
jgi:hypothetical protein